MNGSQMMLAGDRSDCQAEAAMGAAIRYRLTSEARYKTIGIGLMDYLFNTSGASIDNSSGSYGHVKGYASFGPPCSYIGGQGECTLEQGALPRTPRPISAECYYSDDNARVNMGGLAAAVLLDHDGYDPELAKGALALLRTTGPDGYRPATIRGTELPKIDSWKHYFARNNKDAQENPHYIAQMWALFMLWHRISGVELFKTQALKGIGDYMSTVYCGCRNKPLCDCEWKVTESITEEQVRVLLPLAWRVRIANSTVNRDQLRGVWHDLKAAWVEKGAWGVGTCVFPLQNGTNLTDRGAMLGPPPGTNANYGNGEMSVCQQSGDPGSDLLYESNYLLLNLQEAYAATGEVDYQLHADKLANYIARVQAKSTILPQYNGTFFRGFDYSRWEFFGASGDWGWPSMGIETGWTSTWIAAGLGIPEIAGATSDGSYWSLVTRRSLAEVTQQYCNIMFEENATDACRTTLKSDGT